MHDYVNKKTEGRDQEKHYPSRLNTRDQSGGFLATGCIELELRVTQVCCAPSSTSQHQGCGSVFGRLKGLYIPGPLFCMARKVRQVAGPRLAIPCISLRVAVMLSSFLLIRLSAVKPATLARVKEMAQGRPLRKEDLATSRPHSCTAPHACSHMHVAKKARYIWISIR